MSSCPKFFPNFVGRPWDLARPPAAKLVPPSFSKVLGPCQHPCNCRPKRCMFSGACCEFFPRALLPKTFRKFPSAPWGKLLEACEASFENFWHDDFPNSFFGNFARCVCAGAFLNFCVFLHLVLFATRARKKNQHLSRRALALYFFFWLFFLFAVFRTRIWPKFGPLFGRRSKQKKFSMYFVLLRQYITTRFLFFFWRACALTLGRERA